MKWTLTEGVNVRCIIIFLVRLTVVMPGLAPNLSDSKICFSCLLCSLELKIISVYSYLRKTQCHPNESLSYREQAILLSYWGKCELIFIPLTPPNHAHVDRINFKIIYINRAGLCTGHKSLDRKALQAKRDLSLSGLESISEWTWAGCQGTRCGTGIPRHLAQTGINTWSCKFRAEREN